MIYTMFFRFLSISVTTGILIGILLLLAPLLRKRYTEKWKYWVWLLLAIRLIVPITTPESKAAIVINIPYTESAVQPTADSEITTYTFTEYTAEGMTEDYNPTNFVSNERIEGLVVEDEVVTADTDKASNKVFNFLFEISLWDIVNIIWISGIVFFALYHLISHVVFRRSMLRRANKPQGAQIFNLINTISGEVGVKKNVQIEICKYAPSPMMIGLIRPIFILPKEEYTAEELHFILAHELYHYKRNDLWYKLVLLTANAIHWFNPLVWLMYREANGVLERTCDDAVLKESSYEERKAYTQTILESMEEQMARENNLSTYFYGGKKDLKNRFINILDRKNRRSGKWVLLLVALCVLVAGGVFACGYQNEPEATIQGNDEEVLDMPSEEQTERPELLEQATNEDTVQIGEFVTGEMLGEEVYQELQEEGISYQATSSGIYRVTDAGKECIYNIKPGMNPVMQVYENKLYFKTDITYEEGYLDWADDGIKWIDLETLENGIVDIDIGNRTIESFWISDGFVYMTYSVVSTVAPYEEIFLLADVGKEIFNGKAMEELTESEKQEYGLMLSQWIVDNPGKLLDVSNRTATENFTFLDLDMDGEVERIALQPMKDEQSGYYTILDHHALLLDEEVMVEAYSENLHNKIWAISLGGKEVLIVLYEDGPSGDPYTRLFRYEQGTLVEAGAFGADIRECQITEEGVIQGVFRMDSIQTAFCTVSWRMNELNQLQIVPQEAYDFVSQNEVELLENLTLYTAPNGSERFIIEPQRIRFIKVTSDGKWILLEGAEGVQGWLPIDGYRIVELDKTSAEVFEGLNFAG